MKQTLLLISLFLSTAILYGQTIDFTLADPQPDLVDIYSGSSTSGDVDGDGDIDLIMTGITPGRVTALYLNDGNGNFTLVEDSPLPKASNGLVILKDLDGDTDLDLFFSGNGIGIQEFAHIYLNDGFGVFSLTANPLLPLFQDSGVDLADVDGDGDIDLLLSIKDKDDNFVADVYLNDGDAFFTASGNLGLTAVNFGAVEFIDVEMDGDVDVVISGEKEDGLAITALYLNNGMGSFTIDENTNFIQLDASDIDAADVDNDGDLDILMSGATDAFDVRTILYINDGNGLFTELASAGLQQTFAGTNSISDLDNDGDQDLIIIGSQDGGLPNIYNIVYENMGNNTFIPVDTIGGEYIAACVVDDFNGDALADVIIQGFADRTNVYWNSTILTATDEIAVTPQLQMYPNPTSCVITVSVDMDISGLDLEIYNVEGRLVHNQLNVPNSQNTIPLDLPAGEYIVLLKNENQVLGTEVLIVK